MSLYLLLIIRILNRILKITNDGSATFFLPEYNEHYHSKHGAIQEALHVFIEKGLKQKKETELSILEMGFGTGLNCFLTAKEIQNTDRKVKYVGVEKFPIIESEWIALNYKNQIADHEDIFGKIHRLPWESFIHITKELQLKKLQIDFTEIRDFEESFDLVYYDAFGFRVQPELWDKEIFKDIYNKMNLGGLFVTYSARGQFRRDLESIGFDVYKTNGPIGKREMIIAWKR